MRAVVRDRWSKERRHGVGDKVLCPDATTEKQNDKQEAGSWRTSERRLMQEGSLGLLQAGTVRGHDAQIRKPLRLSDQATTPRSSVGCAARKP